ncbi:methyltransferase domain-containing protein [Legionella sp. CNM-1927-20]|uniref:methyltransferase domain-containing protein n=1 Tax=Legionella sp. CNM-1927-20 TaxID=3422221 RepID=UPI00403ACEEF
MPEKSIDIVYSNYVLHWVSDKKKAFTQINKLLRPQGQFIMNCIAAYSKIISEIETVSGLTYEQFQKKYPLTQKEEWLALLAEYNFTVIENCSIEDFEFACLDEFLLFWEATTQGKYKRESLSSNRYYALIKKYPSKIRLFGNETLSVLCRSKTICDL